jgi:hypothetical protein
MASVWLRTCEGVNYHPSDSLLFFTERKRLAVSLKTTFRITLAAHETVTALVT